MAKVRRMKLEDPDPPLPATKTHAMTVVPRVLPHSLEAEENLLSSCLLDEGATLAKAIAAGIEPRSFYDKKHVVTFGALMDMASRGEPIAPSTLAEHLKAHRQLDVAGGYGFIMQVSQRVPTTAQATYFIERVREQSILRNLILSATSVVENCYQFSGDIDGFLVEQSARVNLAANGYVGNDELLRDRLFDIGKLAEKPEAIFSVGNVPVCTPGNLTTIYAASKAGKTTLQSGMMAATLTNPTSGHDTLGFVGPNYGKQAVIHVDTEQSRFDWQQKTVLTSMKRVGLTAPPPWLMSLHLTGDSAERNVKTLLAAMRYGKKHFGGVRCVFIDGIGDFVRSPNNEEECYELVRLLHATAIEYGCAIICILHLNPTSKASPIDKGRGHLGSQLERKSESNLTLKKEGETTVLLAEGRQRNAPIPADKSPAFRWSDEHQMHRSCVPPAGPGAAPKSTRGRPPTYTFDEMQRAFPAKADTPRRMKELFRMVNDSVPIKSEAQFYNILRRFVEEGRLEQVDVPGGRAYRKTV